MGLLKNLRLRAAQRRYEPQRESLAFPKLISLMGQNRTLGTPKPTPTNLRYFSRTVYARRAINRIKDAIATLPWQVVTDSGARASKQQVELVTRCLENPNESDSFTTLIEQFIEDALVTGAGVLEQAVSPDPARPIWLWPVDATTVRPVVKWDGSPKSVRFIQALGYTGGSILADVNAKQLLAQDILYMRLNPSTESPYGYGPLEIAYDSISWKLGVGRYASNAASNAQPHNLIYAGEVNSQEDILKFRTYWRNEVEGQGQTPIIGGSTPPEVLQLHPGTDDALYLKWQEFLIREIATGFSLSPQSLGVERDVNRNTAETAEDRDWDSAIKPMALRIQAHLNRDVLWARHGLLNLCFTFDGLDREDEKALADIFKTEYQNNACTPNEYRASRGLEPLKSRWADLTYADMQIAMKAAQGAKQVDDPAIQPSSGDAE